MRKFILTGALAAGALVTLGAAGPAPKQDRCFWTQSVNGFTAPDDKTVYVKVGVKETWRLDLFGTCPDVRWNNDIALLSRPGSSICSAMDATIITNGPTGPQRCQVSKITKLTPEEAAALPAKSRP
ncbi:MAG TPA: DUF6491 family protein [Phenylobacterium sp.]|nr:DUF6491 family protein [Phenylobacterium sp.]